MRYSTTKAINLEAHIVRNRELIAKTHQSLHLGLLGGDAEPKADPVFLHVKAGMTVIVDDGKDWRIDSGG